MKYDNNGNEMSETVKGETVTLPKYVFSLMLILCAFSNFVLGFYIAFAFGDIIKDLFV